MAEIKTTVKDIVTELVDKYETPVDPIKFVREINEISKKARYARYLLLICPDLRQYVFIDNGYKGYDDGEVLSSNLQEILLNRGQVVLIDRDNEEQNVWEFYIRDKFDGNLYFYQLVDYTEQTVVI